MQESPTSPLASIIVLFLDGSPWIGGCLESLRRNGGGSPPHEVIVLANGVADGAGLPVSAQSHVRVLRSRVNLGFGGGCNWASLHARGKYLVFLNDDASVEPGWLEALVDAAEAHPEVAAVGSLVLSTAGRIEEAGRVLWSDGVSHGIASGGDASMSSLPRVREVDYSSACSLLVRRSAWEAVGGFDDRYFPAYYEDVDLSIRLRLHGHAIACAAESRVRHQRSVSTSVLWRRFLGLRNHRVFMDRWSEVLGSYQRRPRDQPSLVEIEDAARHAADRRRAIYHQFGMRTDDAPLDGGEARSDIGQSALLERELAALRAELELKDEYIAHIESTAPQMERGLQRVLEDEQRRARRHERIRAVPVLGPAAVWLNRKLAHRRSP